VVFFGGFGLASYGVKLSCDSEDRAEKKRVKNEIESFKRKKAEFFNVTAEVESDDDFAAGLRKAGKNITLDNTDDEVRDGMERSEAKRRLERSDCCIPRTTNTNNLLLVASLLTSSSLLYPHQDDSPPPPPSTDDDDDGNSPGDDPFDPIFGTSDPGPSTGGAEVTPQEEQKRDEVSI
jgi:hypothetical protein